LIIVYEADYIILSNGFLNLPDQRTGRITGADNKGAVGTISLPVLCGGSADANPGRPEQHQMKSWFCNQNKIRPERPPECEGVRKDKKQSGNDRNASRGISREPKRIIP
jgi:hypothetical protein